ncbi:MAG: hypothetical protein JNJ76_09935 [Candidatus Competibacter sp.]|nr:hypothetical protein [Candidatus Competibacter sp.]
MRLCFLLPLLPVGVALASAGVTAARCSARPATGPVAAALSIRRRCRRVKGALWGWSPGRVLVVFRCKSMMG